MCSLDVRQHVTKLNLEIQGPVDISGGVAEQYQCPGKIYCHTLCLKSKKGWGDGADRRNGSASLLVPQSPPLRQKFGRN